MEHLLHYVWKHKLFPLKILQTTKGLLVEIIDSGLQNPDAGPDFFNAKLKIDGTLWVGNIEIHTHSSDWYRHGHDHDKAYDSVILHVVAEADAEVTRSNGEQIPQLLLTCPENVQTHYLKLPSLISYLNSLSYTVISVPENACPHADQCSTFFDGNFKITSHTHAQVTHINIIDVFAFNVNI